MLRQLPAFFSGLLFSIGLAISGMTMPENVMGFLDFTGDWAPELTFVMGGGVVVYSLAFRLITRRKAPLFEPRFAIPTRRDLSPRLLIGAALFGVGWGLGGFCPGPALTSLSTGASTVLLFLASMIGGMFLFQLTDPLITRLTTPTPSGSQQPH
jgi:uncharacterized membrane protein YedE/YeeE